MNGGEGRRMNQLGMPMSALTEKPNHHDVNNEVFVCLIKSNLGSYWKLVSLLTCTQGSRLLLYFYSASFTNWLLPPWLSSWGCKMGFASPENLSVSKQEEMGNSKEPNQRHLLPLQGNKFLNSSACSAYISLVRSGLHG